MNRTSKNIPNRSFLIAFFLYTIPIAMLGLTFIVWQSWNRINEADERRRLEDAANYVVRDVANNLNNYKMFAQGAAGVFAASEEVEREEFHAYFEYRKISTLYPGLQALAFTEIAVPSERPEIIRKMKAEGINDYVIWPADCDDPCAPLLYIEPLNAVNRSLLGWDIFSQATIRAAALDSRDTGEVRITPHIELPLSPAGERRVGFLIIVPIFTSGLSSHDEVTRREAFEGYIVDVVTTEAFMCAILGPSDPDVWCNIYDGVEVSAEGLMYEGLAAKETSNPLFTSTMTIEHYGQPWTFQFASTPAFEETIDSWTSKGILAAGMLIAVLFYLLIRQETLVHRRAFTIAQDLTTVLKESERRYRQHFENVTDVIFSLDVNLCFVDVSPSVEGLLGYRPQELLGHSFADFGLLSPKDMERAVVVCQQLLTGEDIGRQEYEFIAKDGRRLVGEIASRLVEDDGGRRIISVARDITERKRIEDANARQRNLLSGMNLLLQKTLTANSETDAARMCLDIAEKLTGSASGWIGEAKDDEGRLDVVAVTDTGWAPCHVPDTGKVEPGRRRPISSYWDRVLFLGSSQIVNDPAADPDHRGTPEGHPEITAFLGVPLQNEAKVFGMIALANKPGGYTCDDRREVEQLAAVFVQVLDRIRARQALNDYNQNLEEMVEERTHELAESKAEAKRSRDRLNAILVSVADGLVVTNHQARVVLMNPAAEALLGVQFSEIQGKPLYLSIEDGTLKESIRTALEERAPGYQFDFEIPSDKQDLPRILRAKTARIEADMRSSDYMVIVISDVTSEREVDRMKTEFLSTAAHELRTPLTSIQGFSEILLTRSDLAPERQQKYLSYINSEAMALGEIINDLLDISRIESSRGSHLAKQDFDLGGSIQKIVERFQSRIADHSFETHVAGGPLTVFADQEKLQQVMENVLSNAVKYSPQGGTIRTTVKRKEACSGEQADQDPSRVSTVLVSVEDEGIGMTPAQVKKVFEKFWRADASNKAVGGTGLGMSIVKHIVEAHGGKVDVESAPGKGTTVTIEIPERD